MRHALALTFTLLLSRVSRMRTARSPVAPASISIAPKSRQFVEATAAANKMEPLDVYRLLAKAEPQPKIIELISKPAEKVVALVGVPRALHDRAAHRTKARSSCCEHRARLEKARKDTGVAPEYVVAIIGVETFYGRITGKYRVLDALATLAFDYPPRAEFFRSELAQFIALSREEAVDPLTALGSYAGAMGAGQFMPSSYRALRRGRQQRQAARPVRRLGRHHRQRR